MPIIKWEPWSEIDRFFADFPTATFPKMGWDLAIDLYEDKGNIVAEMNLPGIDAEKIDVAVEDGYLRISGSREEEKEIKEKQYYSKEIRRGSFERMVRLPYDVQKEKVSAEHKNGVLRVTLPKAGGTPAGKIKVNVKK